MIDIFGNDAISLLNDSHNYGRSFQEDDDAFTSFMEDSFDDERDCFDFISDNS